MVYPGCAFAARGDRVAFTPVCRGVDRVDYHRNRGAPAPSIPRSSREHGGPRRRRRRTHRPLFPAGRAGRLCAQRVPGSIHNNGDWTFRDDTARAGLQMWGQARGPSWRHGQRRRPGPVRPGRFHGALYRNDGVEEGVARFTDVTPIAGVPWTGCARPPMPPSSAAWLDYDHDGKLDLVLVNNLDWRGPAAALKRRRLLFPGLLSATPSARSSSATRGTARSGYDGRSERVGKREGIGGHAADLDGDGWDDILTAND